MQTPGKGPTPIRDRTAAPASVRRPEMLPPTEIRELLSQLVELSAGVSRDELIPAAARHFGFKSTSKKLRDVLSREIDQMRDSGRLSEQSNSLTLNVV